MKLFQMEVYRLNDGRVLLAHFPNRRDALGHIEKTFDGWEVRNVVEITQPAHFELAELDTHGNGRR